MMQSALIQQRHFLYSMVLFSAFCAGVCASENRRPPAALPGSASTAQHEKQINEEENDLISFKQACGSFVVGAAAMAFDALPCLIKAGRSSSTECNGDAGDSIALLVAATSAATFVCMLVNLVQRSPESKR